MAVLEANGTNFDELIQADYSVIDMYANGCGACVALAPVFEAASIDMPFLTFAHLKIRQDEGCTAIANRYNIKAIPTLLYFRRGELIFKTVGSMDREELDTQLAKLLYG